MNENDEQEIDLLKLFSVLLDKIHYIIIALVLGCVVGYLGSRFFIDPTYESDVMVYVNNSMSISTTSISLTDLNASSSLVEAYEVILNSRDTLKEIAKESNLDYTYKDLSSMVSSSQQSETAALKITVTANSADDAYKIANTITKVLPDRINQIIDGSSTVVIDYAQLPTEKSGPSNTKNAIIVGAVFMVAEMVYVVVVYFFLKDEIQDEDEITSNFNVPVLAVIPDLNIKISEEEASFNYYAGAYDESKKQSNRKKGVDDGTI